MRINTNISALIANSHLRANDNLMSDTMERLSSGLKLNRSADDSAGMAIASRMRTQIRGLDQANENASDGVSLVQTAEGALNEVTAMIQRMRELAVQGANGTNSDAEREAITQEISALQDEIERIGATTEFNGKPLLDGSQERRRYNDVVGTDVTYLSDEVPAGDYAIKVTALSEQGTNTYTISEADSYLFQEKSAIRINDYEIMVQQGDSVADVKAKIIEAADKLNLTAEFGTDTSVTPPTNVLTLTTYEYGSSAEIITSAGSQELCDALGFTLTDTVVTGVDMQAELIKESPAPADPASEFANTAVITCEGNKAIIRDNGGFEMEYKLYPDEMKPEDKDKLTDNNPDTSLTISTEVKDLGMMTLHIGAREGQIVDVNIREISLESLGIDLINTNTEYGCGAAITALDGALDYVTKVRSSLGAYQNRLDSTISNLSVVEENMTAAISRIEDADMAKEMTEFTKLQVLTQASTSMVAQANERPQTVLQLLQ